MTTDCHSDNGLSLIEHREQVCAITGPREMTKCLFPRATQTDAS
jgi:hypothetical protein